VKVQFGISFILFIRFTKVEILIRQVKFHIIIVKTLFLLSLADIDKLRVYFNNFTNLLVTLTSYNVLVVRRFGHLFLL
jgi:hypothetical protein